MRVLIVEDQTEVRNTLSALVESLGFEVDLATNTTDGLAMLSDDSEIGVVLLDLGLPPDPNSFSEGMRFLKDAAARSSITKVIVITGQTAAAATEQAIQHGAFDFLMKPITREELKQALNRAVLYYARHANMCKEAQIAMYIVADGSSEESAKNTKDAVMTKLFRTVLNDTNHNVSAAARRLNMSREHLYYYLKKYGIKRKK